MGLSVLALHGVTSAVYVPDARVGETISLDFQQDLLTKEAVMQLFDAADHATCGHRVSLNNLAKYTLQEEKLLNSEKAVLLWRAGLTLLEDRQERDTVEARYTGASHLFRTVIRY